MYIYHGFLIHSSANGHIGFFNVLAIVNSAAMNIDVHVSLSILVSSVHMPSSEIAGSYDSLLLGRKVITNLDSIFKSRDITLPTKVRIVKTMAFPVVKYRCESWTIMKTETEELMLSNCGAGEDSLESLGQQGDPTSLKEVNLEYSLERLMLKLQCFGHLIQRANSLR